MKRLLLVVVMAAGVLAGTGTTAEACSCAPPFELREALEDAAGAIVGTPVDVRESSEEHGYPVRTYTFEVERAVKGPRGPRVDVDTSGDGASCGAELELHRRIAIFLTRFDDAWHTGLCSGVDPDRLVEAARPLPRPDGQGPPYLVVGTAMGPARTVALDAEGRTVVYAEGPGATTGLARCPGGDRFVEVAVPDVVVRTVDTLGDVRTVRLPGIDPMDARRYPVAALACLDPLGQRLLVALTEVSIGPFAEGTTVFAVDDGAVRIAADGPWARLALAPGNEQAYAVDGTALDEVDLTTGDVRRLAVLPAFADTDHPESVAVSPDGTTVAMALDTPNLPASVRVALVDAATGESTLAAVDVNVREVLWLGPDELAVAPYAGPVRVFDRELREIRRLARGSAAALVRSGDALYSLHTHQDAYADERPWTAVRRIPLDGSRTELLARVDAADSFALLVLAEHERAAAAVETQPAARPAPAPSPTRNVGAATYVLAAVALAALVAAGARTRRRVTARAESVPVP